MMHTLTRVGIRTVLLAGFGFCLLPAHAKADTLQFSGWSPAMTHYYTYTFTVNIDKSTYSTGDTVTATSQFVSNVCANGYSEGDGGTVTATVNGVTQTIEVPYQLVGVGTFTAPNSPGSYAAQFNATGTGYGEPLYANAYQDYYGNWYIDTSGPLAQGSASIPYTVVAPPPPTAWISASPTSVVSGSGTTLSWGSTNASWCERTGVASSYIGSPSGASYSSGTGIGTSNPGTMTLPLTYNPTQFNLHCRGLNGSDVYSSVTVSIVTPVNGACGTANGVSYSNGSSSYSPYSQCSSGTPSTTAFPGAGMTQNWTCSGANGGSTSGTCSASQQSLVPVNGACGTANGVSYANGSSSYSPYAQCSSGSPSTTAFPTAGNTQTWTCSGTNGGAMSPTCSASQQALVPVNGTCGTANGVSYPNGSSSYSPYAQCSSGSPSTTSFPTAGNTQTWTCSGTNGGAASPTCSASQQSPSPTASLSANPSTINTGQSSTLTWSSSNATSCTGTGFSTGNATSGSVSTGALSQTSAYQVTCSGPGGTTAPAAATVSVVQPVVTITAAPIRVRAGTNSVIYWNATNVASCQVTGPGLSSTALSGSQSVAINTQATYTITCQTLGSPTAQSATVNVVPNFQNY